MKIAVTGASGLVGSALCPRLEQQGHETVALTRARDSDGIHWDPAAGEIDAASLEGFDAVVHLAGESIAEGRWTKAKKARIHESRRDGTRLLAQALAGLQNRPSVLVSASAIGYYGDRDDEVLTVDSAPGEGFLAEVCQDWEAAAQPAAEAGIRVVHPRIGVVLSREGGALKKMLLPFKLGVGGRIGSGRQYWSWIQLDDLVSAISHLIHADTLHGAVNAVAPNPVTNREFTKALGRVLSRPTFLPMPAFAARLALGQMANDLLLASTRVIPSKLQESGFSFEFPTIEDALRRSLHKEPTAAAEPAGAK